MAIELGNSANPDLSFQVSQARPEVPWSFKIVAGENLLKSTIPARSHDLCVSAVMRVSASGGLEATDEYFLSLGTSRDFRILDPMTLKPVKLSEDEDKPLLYLSWVLPPKLDRWLRFKAGVYKPRPVLEVDGTPADTGDWGYASGAVWTAVKGVVHLE